MAAAAPQKLFLVDAMGFVFRASFAPLARLSNPQFPRHRKAVGDFPWAVFWNLAKVTLTII
jgi:hypothetical protein